MENLVIRRFDKNDVQDIVNILYRNFMEVLIKDYSKEEMKSLSAAYNFNKVLFVASYAHMYVACLNNEIIGCGSISSFWGKLDDEGHYRLEKFR